MNTVPELFSSAVERYRDRTAVAEKERRITYGNLYSMAEDLSAFLLARGIGEGDRVAIFLPNSIEFVASFFAIAGIGAVSVPINTAYKEEELKFYIAHATVKLVLTEERLRHVAEKGASETKAVVTVMKGDKPLGSASGNLNSRHKAQIRPEEEAIYLYSTGSTGRPKRVARTHFNLIALADNHTRTVGWTENDRILFVVPISHTYGLGNFISAIKVGASVYVLEEFKRNAVIDLMENESITVFPAVPFMLNVLAETFLPKPRNLSSLNLVISAGAPLPGETFLKFHEKFGIYPRQLYGSTETGVISINLAEDIEKRYDSVGRPVNNVEVKIMNEDGTRVNPGETGEIAVKSPSMTAGYYGLPDETNNAFRDGFYFTGDLGRIDDDGYIYISGRKKLFINISGNKVDPQEVERVILQHPRVKEAVVLGTQDKKGMELVKAVIVSRGELDIKEICEFCDGKIADFKIPRIIEFREAIPKSPTGKVLRQYLK